MYQKRFYKPLWLKKKKTFTLFIIHKWYKNSFEVVVKLAAEPGCSGRVMWFVVLRLSHDQAASLGAPSWLFSLSSHWSKEISTLALVKNVRLGKNSQTWACTCYDQRTVSYSPHAIYCISPAGGRVLPQWPPHHHHPLPLLQQQSWTLYSLQRLPANKMSQTLMDETPTSFGTKLYQKKKKKKKQPGHFSLNYVYIVYLALWVGQDRLDVLASAPGALILPDEVSGGAGARTCVRCPDLKQTNKTKKKNTMWRTTVKTKKVPQI